MASPSHGAGNPRTYPVRANALVRAEVDAAEHQRTELLAAMASTGQSGALIVAHLEVAQVSDRGWCTVTTWSEGPTTVLPVADVVTLFELPRALDADPRVTWVRWDVVERVCAASCWQRIAGLDPTRLITRRWPTHQQLEVLRALSLPALAGRHATPPDA